MQDHVGDPGVYIRSLGTRGQQGGISLATKEVVMVLDAAGFDVVLVETAGVGQTELDILKLAQTVLVVLVPESGDSIQVMKAGLMEIADVFAVNKSDRPEADKLVREIAVMLGMNPEGATGGWDTPVLRTEATRDVGVSELLDQLMAHQAHLTKSGMRAAKDRRFIEKEMADILTEKVRAKLDDYLSSEGGKAALELLIRRKTDPYSVADAFFRDLSGG
jgi:LAO/AO transport system kinase